MLVVMFTALLIFLAFVAFQSDDHDDASRAAAPVPPVTPTTIRRFVGPYHPNLDSQGDPAIVSPSAVPLHPFRDQVRAKRQKRRHADLRGPVTESAVTTGSTQ